MEDLPYVLVISSDLPILLVLALVRLPERLT